MWVGVVFCALLVLGQDARAGEQESRVVKTASGPVRGYKDPDSGLYIFYSIPYATAPTGIHRFKAPLPAPVWFQTFEAVNKGIVCPQGSFMAEFSNNKRMQEDCLIANVYVPDTEETNLPVVVYVHGGAYQVGFGDLSTPKNLVKSKKIIAVTFNYRLSIHGFLCLGTEGAPGNAGMKDQVAMLRWVQKNIANFGGNPDDVTINGFSAGSSAVDLLMISPSTEGLFNKVIPESGANSAVWSVQINPLENARAHAKTLNFTNVDDVYALETFYQTAPFEILTSDVFMDRADSSFLFSPCVERETGVERFLDDAPVNILKQGRYNKVPMLYGFANMEGLFRVNFGFEIFNFKEKMNQKFSDFLPADLQFENTKQKEEMAKKVKEFYFGEKAISEETLLEYIDYFTDVIFAYPTLRSLRLQVEAGNDRIYLYEYSFVDEETAAMVPMMNKFKVNGADHCAQTAALMDGLSIFAEDESKLPKDFRKMKAVMRELWLNFITTSNPVPAGSSLPAWPAAGADGSPHMSLNRTLQLRGPLLQRRVRFWDDIYERHYLMPVPPRTPPLRQTHSEL